MKQIHLSFFTSQINKLKKQNIFFYIIFLFSLLYTPLTASPEYSCPGEDVANVNGALGDAYKKYKVENPTGNVANQARYWKFRTDVNGSITIHQENNKPVNGYYNHKLQVGSTCGATDIHSGGSTTNDSTTFDVYAGVTYYVRVKENNTRNQLNFDIEFDFTKQDIITYECGFPRAFTTRFNKYMPGDLVAIGNSNICADETINATNANGRDGLCDANQLKRNDTSNIIYINKYSSPETDVSLEPSFLKNTTGATLTLPADANVTWAGLYWQGEVWNFKIGSKINGAGVDSGDDGKTLRESANTIQFKRPGDSSYSPLTATSDNYRYVNLKRTSNGHSYGYSYGTNHGYNADHDFSYNGVTRYENHYQGFYDVTSLLQEVQNTSADGSANGTYWVGDIQATLGRLVYPGVEAAWTLQVAYTLPNAQPRSITITDGYVALYGSASQGTAYANANHCPNTYLDTGVYPYSVSFDINGLLTPKSAGFTTDMTVFVTESDPETTIVPGYPERLTITKKDATIYDVSGANAWNYEIKDKNGTDITDRIPAYNYPIGMTLKNYRMKDALSTEQNTTNVTFSTDTDRLILGAIGFATDLDAPNICYDYDLRIGDHIKISSVNREINTTDWGDENLTVKVLIRSLEADFNFENAIMKLDFTPASLGYITGASKISPAGINAYIDAVDIPGKPRYIAIGEYANDVEGESGGTLESNISTYVKQSFNFPNSGDYDGTFEVIVEGNVTYNPIDGPISYRLSTGIPEGTEGHISKCPSNPTYDPIVGNFNVENTSTSGNINNRLPLYTQITGREYSVKVKHYEKATTGSFDTLNATDAIVEVELIDASSYENNASTGYDTTCQEPTAEGTGIFVDFNGGNTVALTPTNYPQYDDTIALESAAFRIWALTKKDTSGGTNRILVVHNCADAEQHTCFDNLYTSEYRNADDNATEYCKAACTSSSNSECYDCLRKYFAVPLCSRDNFAIRPKAFNVKINDTKQTNGSGAFPAKTLNGNYSDVPGKKPDLAAGYNYQLQVNAMMFDDTTISTGYYKEFQTTDVTPLPSGEIQETDYAILEFNGPSMCTETNNTALAFSLKNSTRLKQDATFKHNNVSTYKLWMTDTEWTKVDQASYPYKTTFPRGSTPQDDCDKSDSTHLTAFAIGDLAGCSVSSVLEGTSYNEIAIKYHPYEFILNVGLYFTPSIPSGNASIGQYLMMNKFSYINPETGIDYYSNLTLHPISMAAILDGNISAIGADPANQTPLSNFIDGCDASSIDVGLLRTSNPTEDGADYILLRYLQYGSSFNNIYEKLENKDSNNTLPSAAFSTSGIGSADFRIYTTFKKKDNTPLDPIHAEYHALHATGSTIPSATTQSYVDWDDTNLHTPIGSQRYDLNPGDGNITYLYAKLTPEYQLYDDETEKFKTTKLFVDVYCSALVTCSNYGITSLTEGIDETTDWHLANMFTSAGVGQTAITVSTYTGADADPYVLVAPLVAKAKSATDVAFDTPDPAKQTDINISIAGPARPSVVKVKLDPQPWLIHDPVNDYYRVKFIGENHWSGIGNAGEVMQSTSTQEKSRRMNW